MAHYASRRFESNKNSATRALFGTRCWTPWPSRWCCLCTYTKYLRWHSTSVPWARASCRIPVGRQTRNNGKGGFHRLLMTVITVDHDCGEWNPESRVLEALERHRISVMISHRITKSRGVGSGIACSAKQNHS